MKAHIKIPKGWRRLRVGELIEQGDLYLWMRCDKLEWRSTEQGGRKYNPTDARFHLTHIRRIKRTKPAKATKG